MVTRPQPNTWTYADLATLPDDGKRYEIIAGELYEMPSPTSEHALIVMNLILYVFHPLVEALGLIVLTAPMDLVLADEDVVQPDLLILLPEQRDQIRWQAIEGPPALIVEVLSPGNARHDLLTKRALYARAGVPEYWLVSPEAMTVEVLTLVAGQYQTHCRVAGEESLTSATFPTLALPTSTVFRW